VRLNGPQWAPLMRQSAVVRCLLQDGLFKTKTPTPRALHGIGYVHMLMKAASGQDGEDLLRIPSPVSSTPDHYPATCRSRSVRFCKADLFPNGKSPAQATILSEVSLLMPSEVPHLVLAFKRH
jgi:hypothetical protein